MKLNLAALPKDKEAVWPIFRDILGLGLHFGPLWSFYGCNEAVVPTAGQYAAWSVVRDAWTRHRPASTTERNDPEPVIRKLFELWWAEQVQG